MAGGQWYAFRVEPFNSANSASTGWQWVVTPQASVTAPAWFNAVAVSSTQVTLSWGDVANETGYRIYRNEGTLLAQVGANTTSYQATGLTGGQWYAFRVEPFNAASSASTGWQSVVMPVERVTAPGWLQVLSVGNGRANLYWGDAVNETGYRIYHWENGRAVQIASVGANITFFQTGYYARNQWHYFLLEAFNANSQATSAWQWVWL